MASSVRPDILCIDEALGVGDEEFAEKSNDRVQQLTREAGVVFLVSHSIATVRRMCSRAIWIDRGEIITDGDVDQVCDQYTLYAHARRDVARTLEADAS